jgi:hypothetical protein
VSGRRREAQLHRILHEYAGYYNGSRTHRALNHDAPVHQPVQSIGPSHHDLFSAASITNIAGFKFFGTQRLNYFVSATDLFERQNLTSRAGPQPVARASAFNTYRTLVEEVLGRVRDAGLGTGRRLGRRVCHEETTKFLS